MIPFLLWWLIALVLGWLAFPLAARIFQWLPDRGYTGAKALGLLVASYILWLGASAGFLHNDLGGIIFAFLFLAILSIWIWRRNPKTSIPEESQVGFLKHNQRVVLVSETLFLLAFGLWTVLRAYAPDKIMNAGGEKFMEIAFLNGILNSQTFPPLDPWLSGFAIAYYYFGYVMMAFMTRLSGVPAGVGFDLYDALLFALTVVGAFGVVYNLVATSLRLRSKSSSDVANRQPVYFGLLGALFVAVLGNLEGLLESIRARGALSEAFFSWIDVPDLINAAVTGSWYPGTTNLWWWWRGSRVIQDVDLSGNPLGVSPITEFPFFSFLLGDNHPHVLGLPFVLLAVGLAMNLLLWQVRKPPDRMQDALSEKAAWWNPIHTCLDGDAAFFFFTALILGGLAFLNTWDFPIYLGLTLLAFIAGLAARDRQLDRPILVKAMVLGAGLLVGAFLFYLFFYVSFDSQAGGLLPYIFRPTRLVQYLVMFGIFFFILLGFLILVIIEYSKQGHAAWRLAGRTWGWVFLVGAGLYALIVLILVVGSWLSQSIPQLQNLEASLGGIPLNQAVRIVALERLQNPWLFIAITGLVGLTLAALQMTVLGVSDRLEDRTDESRVPDPALLFTLLLILVGILLSWSVEFVYLRDSFMVRMNTVFKFYYQAWIMLACASAYALWWAVETLSGKPVLRSLTAVAATILILAGMVYPVFAFHTRVVGFSSEPNLDGASGIARSNPDDWAAIQWLRLNAGDSEQVPVILEAPGRSYNYEGRISAFTGFPTVLGWAIHESQWRGSYEEQGRRELDIAAIYSTHDPAYALDLLHNWDVKYVVLGRSEENYIRQLCANPAQRCNPSSAIRKFDLVLAPVFTRESVKIYAVPGR
jgi:YYY domain-containing protein